jgi:hypothetical protein
MGDEAPDVNVNTEGGDADVTTPPAEPSAPEEGSTDDESSNDDD